MKAKILLFLSGLLKNKYTYIILVILTLFALTFLKGCQYGMRHKICPPVNSQVVYVHDTVTHTIIDVWPYYIQGKDSIIYRDVPAIVDTAEILKDYFSTHIVNRQWKDSLIQVQMTDYISKNEPYHNKFSYKILRDQQIINTIVDNSKHYYNSVTFGVDLPLSNINLTEIEATYNFKKGYVGAGWSPGINQKSISLRCGVSLLRW